MPAGRQSEHVSAEIIIASYYIFMVCVVAPISIALGTLIEWLF